MLKDKENLAFASKFLKFIIIFTIFIGICVLFVFFIKIQTKTIYNSGLIYYDRVYVSIKGAEENIDEYDIKFKEDGVYQNIIIESGPTFIGIKSDKELIIEIYRNNLKIKEFNFKEIVGLVSFEDNDHLLYDTEKQQIEQIKNKPEPRLIREFKDFFYTPRRIAWIVVAFVIFVTEIILYIIVKIKYKKV